MLETWRLSAGVEGNEAVVEKQGSGNRTQGVVPGQRSGHKKGGIAAHTDVRSGDDSKHQELVTQAGCVKP